MKPEPTPDDVAAARANIARDLASIARLVDAYLLIASKTTLSPAGRQALREARAGVSRLVSIIRDAFGDATVATHVDGPPRDSNGNWRH